MKRIAQLTVASSIAVIAANAFAQDDDDFSSRQNDAGREVAEPETGTASQSETDDLGDLSDILSAGPAEDAPPIVRDGQSFGWQVEPTAPATSEEEEGELTELERLSQSSSGLQYGSGLYDAKSDNPLEPVSVTFRALDKITAKYTDLIIEIDETSEFGDLAITPRTCDKRPPDEFPEVTAFLEIENIAEERVRVAFKNPDQAERHASAVGSDAPLVDVSVPAPGADIPEITLEPEEEAATPAATDIEAQSDDSEKNPGVDGLIFSGWMFASSPSLSALEHPVYDVWVIDCKMVDPSTL